LRPSLPEPVTIVCPYCGQPVEIVLDPENEGILVQDCEVCCSPWELTVAWDAEGMPRVRVERLT